MPHTDHSPTASSRFYVYLLPASVVLYLCILGGTYFAYYLRNETHSPGSNLPLAVGTTIFVVLMLSLNYLAFSSPPLLARLTKAVGITLVETIVFLYLFMLLLLNTFGS